MSPQSIALVLGITALLAVIPILAAARHALAFGDWDLTATFVLAVGVVASLPTIVSSLGSSQPVTTNAFGNVEVGLSAGAYRLDQAGNAALLAGSVLFFALRCFSGRVRINVAPLIAAGICLVTATSDALNGHQMFVSRQVVLLAVLLAAAVARPGRSAFLGAAATGLLLTFMGGVRALINANAVFRDCRSDKCSVFGVLYTGVFPNENTFGLALALSIPFIWIALRGPVRVVLAFYVGAVVLVTGSRQATATAVAALLFLLLLAPRLREPRSGDDADARSGSTGRSWLALGGIAVAAGTSVVLPFLNLGPDALSQREAYWSLARGQLQSSPIIGFGAKAWADLYQVGQIPVALTYSLHNQWLDVLYAGGIIGLAGFLALLGYLLLRGGSSGLAVASCVIIPVLVTGSLERPWSFGINDWLSFTLVAATLIPVTARGSAGRAGTGPTDRRRRQWLSGAHALTAPPVGRSTIPPWTPTGGEPRPTPVSAPGHRVRP
ncbi:O-antigen ligase family protein [Streptacidiphilus sp. EB129]|uniref:O-antigen ligase family protein n=1 Tax=Streptacidiphilus sp. EB129 TaxID=3156262 RepID=UPI003513FC1E